MKLYDKNNPAWAPWVLTPKPTIGRVKRSAHSEWVVELPHIVAISVTVWHDSLAVRVLSSCCQEARSPAGPCTLCGKVQQFNPVPNAVGYFLEGDLTPDLQATLDSWLEPLGVLEASLEAGDFAGKLVQFIREVQPGVEEERRKRVATKSVLHDQLSLYTRR